VRLIDDLQGGEWTPVMLASKEGHTETVKILVAAKAQLDTVAVRTITCSFLRAQTTLYPVVVCL
jgi:ankyrin repeat protein